MTTHTVYHKSESKSRADNAEKCRNEVAQWAILSCRESACNAALNFKARAAMRNGVQLAESQSKSNGTGIQTGGAGIVLIITIMCAMCAIGGFAFSMHGRTGVKSAQNALKV